MYKFILFSFYEIKEENNEINESQFLIEEWKMNKRMC